MKLSIQQYPPIFVSIHTSSDDLLNTFRFYGIAVKDVNISSGINIIWDIRRTLIDGQSDDIIATTSHMNLAITKRVLTSGTRPLYGSFVLHDSISNISQQFFVNETHETLAKKLYTFNPAIFLTASLTLQQNSSSCSRYFTKRANVANERCVIQTSLNSQSHHLLLDYFELPVLIVSYFFASLT